MFTVCFHMQVNMGIYLSSPKTEKVSEDGENDRLRYGLSSMQGWRSTMEDAVSAFMCAFSQSFVILKFPSLFVAKWTFYAFEKIKLSSFFSRHVLPLSCTWYDSEFQVALALSISQFPNILLRYCSEQDC